MTSLSNGLTSRLLTGQPACADVQADRQIVLLQTVLLVLHQSGEPIADHVVHVVDAENDVQKVPKGPNKHFEFQVRSIQNIPISVHRFESQIYFLVTN